MEGHPQHVAPGWERLLEVKAVDENLGKGDASPPFRDHAEQSLAELIEQIRPAIQAGRLRDPRDPGPLSAASETDADRPKQVARSPLVTAASNRTPQNIVTYSGLIIDLDLVLPEV